MRLARDGLSPEPPGGEGGEREADRDHRPPHLRGIDPPRELGPHEAADDPADRHDACRGRVHRAARHEPHRGGAVDPDPEQDLSPFIRCMCAEPR